MEFSWTISAEVIAVNLLCIGLMIGTQYVIKLPPRNSIIPGTNQFFLYWQDFYCQFVGDTLGLVLIQLAFAHIVNQGINYPLPFLITFAVVAATDAVFFTQMCLSDKHKPDYGFPVPGKISLSGRLHSVYHGVNVAIIVAMVYFGVVGQAPLWTIIVAAFGLAIWIGGVIADAKSGNFNPLKKQ